MRIIVTKLGYWRRLGAAVVAMLTGVPGMPSRAATTDVPQSWVIYAQQVGQQFQAWIEADDPDADRFHQYLDARMGEASPDHPPASTILVRAWIGPDGRVTQVLFDSLGDTGADATLRTLLTVHPVPSSPPPDMRQPLRIRLHIQPNPDAAPAKALSGSLGIGGGQEGRRSATG
ncbi:YbaB/EbfC family DNA-binding protein [Burkholderia sp. WAC0059]|uniref:YbaB/EbfC family DNA-binding protein n=1 Tax=Burkholderia sp. WAC0059 TaxID=2066022 RepID=UPI0015E0F693|nr:YbaB/EbfC family DNA-binding protein [Burkholderia sp. WAC0059]